VTIVALLETAAGVENAGSVATAHGILRLATASPAICGTRSASVSLARCACTRASSG
jgi:hypothetical protein